MLPPDVKIGGHVFTVHLAELPPESGSRSSLLDGEIVVNSGWPKSLQESAFLHEVLDLASTIYRIGLDHRDTTILGEVIYQVMADLTG
ncbi:MAG: hypothetical protein HPY55_06690 [Firmicutes bacterium]|nr:hypothetical protein [Bacillota bacterium]